MGRRRVSAVATPDGCRTRPLRVFGWRQVSAVLDAATSVGRSAEGRTRVSEATSISQAPPCRMTFCSELHGVVRRGTLHSFPFDGARLPKNGIYVLFERGEVGHGGSRIVRVGTHRGDGELPSRLLQHFVMENKDRSIFRKHMG